MKIKDGFTLVEMLFVMAIIVMLMLFVIPSVSKKTEDIKDKGCDILIDVIDAQIQLYALNEGVYPNSVQDLIDKGYIKEKQGVCPNGKRIGIANGQASHE